MCIRDRSKALDILKHDLETKTKNLEDIYIKSPIEGTVTRVNARLGRNAADTENKQAMFVVENLEMCIRDRCWALLTS